MTRLSFLRRDELDPATQDVWDQVIGTSGTRWLDESGALVGPFNAFVHAPAVGASLAGLGVKLLSGTSIERRLTEVAVITVGSHWKAEFEWWAHARMARDHGVADAVVDAIGRGEEPPFTAQDERIVYAVARELMERGQLSQPAYAAARDLLGQAGLVELVSVCGYYTLISYLLNAFEVAIPQDAEPQWANQTGRSTQPFAEKIPQSPASLL